MTRIADHQARGQRRSPQHAAGRHRARCGAVAGAVADSIRILNHTSSESPSGSSSCPAAFRGENGGLHRIPQMRGAGSNTVLSLPNGTVAVVLGRDGYEHEVPEERVRAVIAASDAARPF